MKNISLFSIAVVGLAVMSTAPAQATTTYNADLASPFVYYGTGNSNGAFTVSSENGVELGLRGHVYQKNPTAPAGAVYDFALGQTISFDWSFNPGADGSAISLDGVISSMTITNLGTGGSFTFNPSLLGDNAINTGAPGGYQNSWRLSFSFLNSTLGYNAGDNAGYKVSWDVSGTNIPAINDTIYLRQGTGAVPEPATWAMMVMGIGLVGAAMRRRVKAVSFA